METKMEKAPLFRIKCKEQRGYTLLEYCAGAAVVAGIIFAALEAMGGQLSGYLGAIGDWATRRAAEVSSQ
jgi:Flp pilus assembly pilin Flp